MIWFADLRGFTRLADSVAPETLIETLNDFHEAMARPVIDNGGEILKFLGDGMLAIFDLTGRDAAAVCDRALAAAADLRRRFPELNAEREAAGKPAMAFGLALHMGEVLFGNIGAEERLDFTVVGPAVNETSRMQALCAELGHNVLVSRTVGDAVGTGDVRLRSLGAHTLRGVREPKELLTLDAWSVRSAD